MTDEQPASGLPRTVLGGHAASCCPVRTQLDVLQPCEPAPPSPERQLRLDHGLRFERHIFDRLRLLHPEAVAVDPMRPSGHREASTLEAMRTGARLIVGGRLPTDRRTRRVGEPDLLVRDGTVRTDDRWRYVPVDIKNHRTLTPRTSNSQLDATVSSLAAPTFGSATAVPLLMVRHRRADALQLAHYRRMLEQVGHAAENDVAGIVGISEHIAWYRLDEPIWRTPAKRGARQKTRTTMAVYDFEYDFRCDIATNAEQGDDESLLVEPMWCAECQACPWRPHCEPLLRAGDGDVSLLPRLDYRRWRELRTLDIRSRRDLIEQVPESAARLAAAFSGERIARLRQEAAKVVGSTPVGDLVAGSVQQAALGAVGVRVAQDVAAIPAISDRLQRWNALHRQVVAARAALAPEPFLFLDGVQRFVIPRADIEVDIDMENSIDDRVYLWGALITDRTGAAPQAGYRPTADWSAMVDPLERSLFEDFWSWLTAVRAEAGRRSLSFRAYCWHAAAENRRLRELSSHDAQLATDVAAFIASDEWVDLERVWQAHATTGQGSRLKQLAPLAGFSWRAADADGATSTAYYERAASGDSAARQWLLDYNEDDCRATATIRDWMDAAQVPGST